MIKPSSPLADASVALVPLAVGLAAAVVTGVLALGTVGLIGSAVVIVRRSGGWRAAWPSLGLARPARPSAAIALGAFGAIALYLLLSRAILPLATRILGAPDLEAFRAIEGNVPALIAGLVAVWGPAAFGEEIVFRGWVQPRLSEALGSGRRGRAAAIGLAALLFGASHFYQGPAGIVGTAVAGLVFGGLVRPGRGGLWPAVLAHGGYDTFGFVTIFFGGVDALR